MDLSPALIFKLGIALSFVATYASVIYFGYPRKMMEFLEDVIKEDWVYITIAFLAVIPVKLATNFRTDRFFTNVIYAIEGNAVAIFQTYTSIYITVLFSAIYLLGYPCLILYTFHRLKLDSISQTHRYVYSYVLLFLISAPFYFFTPVKVTGHVISVEPLLYNLDSVIYAGITSIDTLAKAFPSMHTGLSVLASLHAFKVSKDFAKISWLVTGLIILSTFYLGIHWITDAVAGALFALISYKVSQKVDIDRLNPVFKTPKEIKFSKPFIKLIRRIK